MQTIKYKVEDMHCASCKKAIEKALLHLSGVNSVDIDLDTHVVTLEVEEGTDEPKLVKTIKYLGYTPERMES